MFVNARASVEMAAPIFEKRVSLKAAEEVSAEGNTLGQWEVFLPVTGSIW